MRVTSLKTIYLTEEELKQVISNHLREKGDHILAEHLHTNICTMEWLKNGNFAISIDGEVNEKCLYTAVSSRIDKLNNDTKEMKSSNIPMRIIDKFLEDVWNITKKQ